MSLATLLGPLTVQEVIATLEQRKYQRVSCGNGERLASVFGWSELVAILNLYQTSAQDLRVLKNGKPVPLSWLNGSSSGESLDGRAFHALARQGVSIIANHLEKKYPLFHAVVQQMDAAFGSDNEIAAYATFGAGWSSVLHFDDGDIIVIQIAGSKDWEIIGKAEDVACEHGYPTAQQITASFTMHPGDIFILPYGLAHRCRAPAVGSLHIGLFVDRPYGYQYVKWLQKKAKHDPALRRPAPFGADGPALSRYATEVNAAIGNLMGTYSLQSFLEEKRAGRNSPITMAHLPNLGSDE